MVETAETTPSIGIVVDWATDLKNVPDVDRAKMTPEACNQVNGIAHVATIRRNGDTVDLVSNRDEDSVFWEVWHGDHFSDPIYGSLAEALAEAKQLLKDRFWI